MTRTQKIVESLHDAKSGNEVYVALCEVPTENLYDMLDMINHILVERNITEINVE